MLPISAGACFSSSLDLQQIAGGLIDQQSECDQELALIQQVLL
jgi:hypothetical protein